MSLEEATDFALTSLLARRLAFLAGAGLSMPPPSNLPRAADLAETAQQRYAADFGISREPLPNSLEDQADFFLVQGQLGSIFLTRYIDSHVFSAPHNPGHTALADLLLSGAVDVTVTTNVDTMIERAGEALFGRVGKGIDGEQMAAIPLGTAPLLKIHGCWISDFQNTVWTASQLASEPIRSRIESASAWLAPRLINRDLVILGFSTDWDYLNAILAKVMESAHPSAVLLVNPTDIAQLEEASPDLLAVSARTENFMHLRAGGDVFLEHLRLQFSKSFMRRVLAQGVGCFEDVKGSPPSPVHLEPPDLHNDDYWQIRRDMLGCKPNEPSLQPNPVENEFLGLLLLLLQSAGATCEGAVWKLNGETIRVLRSAPRFLHAVEGDFEKDGSPLAAPDKVIVVGADRMGLRSHFARAPSGTVVRGGISEWITSAEAIEELAL